MLFLFSQNTKTQTKPILNVSSRFVFFLVRCLCLGLLVFSSSLTRVIALARVYVTPGTFLAYRFAIANSSFTEITSNHKSDAITLYVPKPLPRVFFIPHRFLTVLFFFVRLFFVPSTNNNSKLVPNFFCFLFRTLTLFRLWL